MQYRETSRRPCQILTLLLLGLTLALPQAAGAQCNHGVSTFKTCETPKRTCATAADCSDGLECTNDVCDPLLSNLTNCVITVAHADTCGDTTKIRESFDTVDVGGDNVRVPAVGDLPIDSVNDNAVCCAGPVLPCFVGPAGSTFVVPAVSSGCGNLPLPGVATAGSVTFRQNTYVVQPNDTTPLEDQATEKVQDLCNISLAGCSTLVSSIQFGAATDLLSGCSNPATPDSTPCTDTDNDLCTQAGCNGLGVCDQTHLTDPCQTDDCNTGQCNPQTGQCVPKPDSSPCADSDGNPCTLAGCESGGGPVSVCSQTNILPDSTPCPNGGNECAQAGCNGQGTCDPLHVLTPDGGPCTDTDGDLCTLPQCDGAGICDQNHDQVICADPLCEVCDPNQGQCVPPSPLPAGCGLHHFGCYEVHRTLLNLAGVSLVDQFGPSTVTLKKAKRLCAPANKNGEDPTAPADPGHLTFYTLKQTAPKFVPIKGVTVTNQFGQIVVDVTKPDRLLVPTSKSLTSSPLPLTTSLDHYKCYRVKGDRFRRAGITVETQFGPLVVDIKAPLHLCAPVDTNGGGIADPVSHLMCYKVIGPRPQVPPSVFTNNQFEVASYSLFGIRELCVPSLKTLP